MDLDLVILGAGAAGLMAAISAGRAARAAGCSPSILLVDGALHPGAKILVAGGGRCNVTHDVVDESAYAGSSRNAIRKVLMRFPVDQTVVFFRDLGVELKREETGKLFPTTDSARSVLNALLSAAQDAGVTLLHPWRVDAVRREGDEFILTRAPAPASPAAPGPFGRLTELRTRRLILATGGRSLPKTGSDGRGYDFARALGHSLTPRILPALVPLTLPRDHFLCALSGLTVPATLELWSGTGKRLNSFTDSTLCTHFGLSGPSVLDISRYYLDAIADAKARRQPPPVVTINWLPGIMPEAFDQELQALARREGAGPVRALEGRLPERLLRALCDAAAVDPAAPLHQLTRDKRRALVKALTGLPLPITGDRGYTHAEVTAGGVPLSEIRLETMESRLCSALHLCGEICDVDGRIGGYNFQWAWASGYVAGTTAASLLFGEPRA